jgi:hypothetical protein
MLVKNLATQLKWTYHVFELAFLIDVLSNIEDGSGLTLPSGGVSMIEL